MDEYLIEEFNKSVRKLYDLYESRAFITLNNFNDLATDGTLQKIEDITQQLCDFQSGNFRKKIEDYTDTNRQLTNALNSYETERLVRALNALKTLSTDEGRKNIESLAKNLDDSALKILLNFANEAMQFRTFLESELPKFNAGIKTLKVTSSLLEDVVCNLNRIVFELGEDRSVRERQEVNIEIRNYLDLLKDPELMETIGLTREMIAEKLAELLNEKGLNTKYLVGVAQEDKPKQNIIK